MHIIAGLGNPGSRYAGNRHNIGFMLSIIVFRRFRALWVRALTTLLLVAYVAVPAYFIVVLGGA